MELFDSTYVGDRVQVIARHKDGTVFATRDTKIKPTRVYIKALLKFLFTGKKTFNSMMNAGFAVTSNLIGGTGTAFSAVAIGTGSTAPAATQTALVTETKRKAGTFSQVTTTVTNDTSKWDATFSSADGLSGAVGLREIGVFNNNTSGGAMLLRQVFDIINLNWTNGDTVQMIVKVQHKQGS